MTARPLLLAALLLGLAACARLSTAQREDIHRWLLCEECVEGELARVVALGDDAVPALAEAVRGPPPERVANMQAQAQGIHDLVGAQAIADQGYTGHYQDNYVALYQRRAIRALREINTPNAHAALLAALPLEHSFRADVREALGAAARVTVSVAGDSQHAAVDSFVKVDPVVVVADSAAGQRGLPVAFRVESGGGSASDSVVMTDSAGRAAVRWRMGDSATANVLRIVAAGRLLRIRAFSHVPGPRLVFLVQPPNGIVGRALTPSPRIGVQDAWGVAQTGFTGVITITIVDTLTHTVPPPPLIDTLINGIATLDNFVPYTRGRGYRLRVTAPALQGVVSDTFSITEH